MARFQALVTHFPANIVRLKGDVHCCEDDVDASASTAGAILQLSGRRRLEYMLNDAPAYVTSTKAKAAAATR